MKKISKCLKTLESNYYLPSSTDRSVRESVCTLLKTWLLFPSACFCNTGYIYSCTLLITVSHRSLSSHESRPHCALSLFVYWKKLTELNSEIKVFVQALKKHFEINRDTKRQRLHFHLRYMLLDVVQMLYWRAGNSIAQPIAQDEHLTFNVSQFTCTTAVLF